MTVPIMMFSDIRDNQTRTQRRAVEDQCLYHTLCSKELTSIIIFPAAVRQTRSLNNPDPFIVHVLSYVRLVILFVFSTNNYIKYS